MLDQSEKQNIKHQTPFIVSELRAVLAIVECDDELKAKARPYVNIEKREIDWNKIFANEFSPGHRAALLWAKSLWLDRKPMKVDPFWRALTMDNNLRTAVLKAVAIRWGVAA